VYIRALVELSKFLINMNFPSLSILTIVAFFSLQNKDAFCFVKDLFDFKKQLCSKAIHSFESQCPLDFEK
jgi:hypothetical protein